MTLWILATLAIFFVQTLLPASIRFLATGDTSGSLRTALGPRDTLPPMPITGARAERALHNMHEALPVFLGLAFLLMVLGKAQGLALVGAGVFTIARLLYVPAYLIGIMGIRSLVWMVSWVGLGMMIYTVAS